MSQVICVDDVFPIEALEVYKKYGVKTPVIDTIYTIRSMTTHTSGKIGVLLNEIVNPKIEAPHPVLQTVFIEPTWNLERFRTLMGHPPKKAEIQEFIKEVLHS